MCVPLCPRGSSQGEGTRNTRDAAEEKLPSSEGACTLLQPARSLCSREIPARLHFTFSFHHFSCPIADKQDGQLCKPPEGDRQAPPSRQRARESWQQPAASAPISSEPSARLCEASGLGLGSASHQREEGRCTQEQRITPASPRRQAGAAPEHHLPVPRAAAGEHRALEGNSCLPDVGTAGGVPGYTATPQQVPASLWGGCRGLEGLGMGPPNVPCFIGIGPWGPLTDASCWCVGYARLLPGLPKTAAASTGMGCIALPVPAKSCVRSANCSIRQEAEKEML